jgi:hypothetical protein
VKCTHHHAVHCLASADCPVALLSELLDVSAAAAVLLSVVVVVVAGVAVVVVVAAVAVGA